MRAGRITPHIPLNQARIFCKDSHVPHDASKDETPTNVGINPTRHGAISGLL